MTGKVTKIVNLSKRSGEKPKPDGTIYKWNIMTVEVEVDDGGGLVIADSFDKLDVGSVVALTKDEQYNSFNAKIHKASPQDDKLNEILKLVRGIDETLRNND